MTLVELLIAMAILVTVSVSTMLVFRGVTGAWRRGELQAERYQQARLLFDLFNRELTSSVGSPSYPFIGTGPSDPERIVADGLFDELFFVGRLPGRTGLVERGYWVGADGELMCHDEEPADGLYATGESERCGRDVVRFDVSYFDGTDWVERWDGTAQGLQAGQLPKAVHVVLGLGGQRAEEFETVIYLPTS